MHESESEVSHVRPSATPPGSSIHGIFQAKVPEWVAISFSMLFLELHINTIIQYVAFGSGGFALKKCNLSLPVS